MQSLAMLPRSLKWTIGILLALALAATANLWIHPVVDNGFDFQAFYCGGAVIAERANPYLDQPLHDCEAQAAPALSRKFQNVTVPAPLPPYALAFFVPLSLLPFLWAKIVWWLILLASIAVSAWVVARLSRLPLPCAIAASALAIGMPSIPQGGLAPVPIALLFLAAYFARRERWTATVVCGALAMIEPHVALPVDAALFLFVPAVRWRFAVAALALAVLSLCVAAPHTSLFYFTSLLPHHAASEVNNLAQFSLTTLLYHLGIPAATAVRIGSVQYAFMVVVGVSLGHHIARRYGDRAFLVAVPAACSVMGGSFIHLSEIAVATLLACMLASRTGANRAWIAVALLAVPWENVINWAPFATIAPACLIVLVWWRWKPMPLLLITASITLVLFFARAHILEVGAMTQTFVSTSHIRKPAPDAPVDVTWKAFNDTSIVFSIWWFDKAMTFAGLGLLLASGMQAYGAVSLRSAPVGNRHPTRVG